VTGPGLILLSPHLVVMEVIVRHRFRIEAQLRLDHLHNRHYADRRRSDLIFDHRHNADERYFPRGRRS
jgi:hypothetical protein